MYQHICKECEKSFENKHKNQIYCSRNCFTEFLNKKKDAELVGEKFGRLTVIRYSSKRGKNKLYECKCDCGNTTYICRDELISGHTKSCGCLKKELSKEKVNDRFGKFINENFVENTSLSQLKATFKNNTSGHKGVCWDKKLKKWRAYIYFKNQRHDLGSYKDINDAIEARKKAEEKYFKPILEKYDKAD